MATKPGPVRSLFHDATVLFVIRTHLISQVMSEQGYNRADAREVANGLADDVVASAAAARVPDAPKVIPAAGIFAWLLGLVQSPAFAQIIADLISLLFPKAPAPIPAPPTA